MYIRLVCFLIYVACIAFSGYVLVEAFDVIMANIPHRLDGQ